MGYHHSTLAGLTVGIADIPVVEDKAEIIEESHKRVEQITKQFRRGLITDDERYNAVTAEWRAAREKLEKRLVDNQDPKNPIVMMMDSGARGNISNFSQLAGMRGLMAAQTDGSWNCQSCQTSAKVCQYSKCSSQLTVPVKG